MSEHNEEIYDETLDDLIRYGDLRVKPMTLQSESSETVEVSDDKQYPDAPYSVKSSGQESVSVSSGSLSYTSRDLVFPGKNGFDLVITRQYDSNDCGVEKLKIRQDVGNRLWFYTVQLEWSPSYAGTGKTKELIHNCDIGPFISEQKCRDHAAQTVKAMRGHYTEYDSNMKAVAYLRNVVINGRVATEPNDFLTRQHGLGHGWKFQFPCIETTTTGNGKKEVNHDFLHIGDGRVYKLKGIDKTFMDNPSGLLAENNEDYPMADLLWIPAGKAEPRYTLVFADGKRVYFNKEDKKLCAMTDKFGNTISFAYPGGNTLLQITDTYGRVLRLQRNENLVQWVMGNTVEYTYHVSNGTLLKSQDKANRVTKYTYQSRMAHETAFAEDVLYQFKDQNLLGASGLSGVDYSCQLLTAITHPTGAVDHYDYNCRAKGKLSEFNATRDTFLVGKRYTQLPDGSRCNEVSYQYECATVTRKVKDSDPDIYRINNYDYKYDKTESYEYVSKTWVRDADNKRRIYCFDEHSRLSEEDVYIDGQAKPDEVSTLTYRTGNTGNSSSSGGGKSSDGPIIIITGSKVPINGGASDPGGYFIARPASEEGSNEGWKIREGVSVPDSTGGGGAFIATPIGQGSSGGDVTSFIPKGSGTGGGTAIATGNGSGGTLTSKPPIIYPVGGVSVIPPGISDGGPTVIGTNEFTKKPPSGGTAISINFEPSTPTTGYDNGNGPPIAVSRPTSDTGGNYIISPLETPAKPDGTNTTAYLVEPAPGPTGYPVGYSGERYVMVEAGPTHTPSYNYAAVSIPAAACKPVAALFSTMSNAAELDMTPGTYYLYTASATGIISNPGVWISTPNNFGSDQNDAYDRLPCQKIATTYNPGNRSHFVCQITQWEYDDNSSDNSYRKGNLTKETVKITGGVNAGTELYAQTTETRYNGTYSIPVERRYQKDANRRIVEQIALDQYCRLPIRKQVLENGVVTAKTEYDYYGIGDGVSAFLPRIERQYHNVTPGQEECYHITYEYGGYSPLPTRKQTPNADGTLISERWEYDRYGRLNMHQDGNGNTVTTPRDALGRVMEEIHSAGKIKRYVYDDTANRVEITDPYQYRTQYRYTPLGQIGEIWLTDGTPIKSASYEYDTMGRIKKERHYHASGRQKAETTCLYNKRGNLVCKQTTGSDATATEYYSKEAAWNGRFTKETASQVTGYYVGVIGSDNPDGGEHLSTTVTYKDPMGNVVHQGYLLDGVEHLDEARYDKLGNKVWYQSVANRPNGPAMTWRHEGATITETDELGRESSIRSDALGRQVELIDKKKNKTILKYDGLNRLTSQITPFSGTRKSELHYRYDGNGNRTEQLVRADIPKASESQETPSFLKTTYTYDGENRLVDTIFPNGAQTRNEYSMGVRTNSKKVWTGMQGGSLSGAAATTYAYGRFGNLLYIEDNLGRIEWFHYDALGVLLHRQDRNGAVTSYAYDCLGRVVEERCDWLGIITMSAAVTGRQERRGTLEDIEVIQGVVNKDENWIEC